jgi:hypothetical protein
MPILSIVKLRHLKAVNPIWFNGDLDGLGVREPVNFRMVGKPEVTLPTGRSELGS